MNTMGDIISTMLVFSTMGVSSVLGGVQYHGENLLLFEYPMVLNTLHGTQDIPHMYHDIPHGTKITKDGISHTTEHPHSTHDILHGTKHPHSTHDIRTCIVITPYGTEHPLWYSRYPHGTHDIATVLKTPTVLHTHYTGWSCMKKMTFTQSGAPGHVFGLTNFSH